MRRPRVLMGIVLLLPLSTGLFRQAMGAEDQKSRLVARQAEAVRLLERAAGPEGADLQVASRLLREAAQKIDDLAGEAVTLPAPDRAELKRTAAELRRQADAPAPGFSPQSCLPLLRRVGVRLRGGDLPFQGSYSQPKIQEPAYGGHASAMGPPPADPASAPGSAGPSPVVFEDVPGLTEKSYCGGPTKDHLIESGGSGIALIDYDNDGRLDIYVVSAFELDAKRRRIPHSNALYRNLGGWKFENVAHRAGVDAAAWGNGVCAGDFDGDGLLDLYVTNWGPNFLFKNKGGTFREVAAEAGVQAGGWSTGCAFFDADGDGDLDLYVARYATVTWDEVEKAQRTMTWRGGPKVMVGPVGLPGAADVFYENRGDGTFVEATDAHGLKDAAMAYGFGVLATDYDGDGWIDLFVANDSQPNFLYHNRGQGRFESEALLAGVALNGQGRAQAGMGVDAGDADGDGLLDLVLTTFAQDSNTLFRSLGHGQFDDVTQRVGLGASTFEPMSWGVAFLDADLDGRSDLFFANGHLYPQVEDFPALKETYAQKSQLFLNDGSLDSTGDAPNAGPRRSLDWTGDAPNAGPRRSVFRDVSATAGGGLQVRKSSRGLAVGDLDDDGDPDLVLGNMDDVPTLLENRQRTGRHWIGLQLKKPGANPFAIGARVSVEAAERRQVREVRSGGSYLSQSDLRAHFGLGAHSGPVNVEVRLGQARWRWTGLPVDRYTPLVLRDQDRIEGGR